MGGGGRGAGRGKRKPHAGIRFYNDVDVKQRRRPAAAGRAQPPAFGKLASKPASRAATTAPPPARKPKASALAAVESLHAPPTEPRAPEEEDDEEEPPAEREGEDTEGSGGSDAQPSPPSDQGTDPMEQPPWTARVTDRATWVVAICGGQSCPTTTGVWSRAATPTRMNCSVRATTCHRAVPEPKPTTMPVRFHIPPDVRGQHGR